MATEGSETPTVVLVHGAFADGSSWSGVIERLQAKGIEAIAPAIPLRGITADSAYVESVLGQIDGPVLAVGHSYGGAVITNAAERARNVVGLVFVAAFATEEGETLGVATAASTVSTLMPALIPRRYPIAGGGTGTELHVDPARFPATFAGDLPAEQAAAMAATQRPIADVAFAETTGVPAWKRLPSWAVIATADKAAGSDVTRSMAVRAGATISEVDASHVVMVSKPAAVTAVILEALAAVTPVAVG